MAALRERLGLRQSLSEKERVRSAAALCGASVASFVRRAAIREADAVLARPTIENAGNVAARLRGRATVTCNTDEVLRLTRGG